MKPEAIKILTDIKNVTVKLLFYIYIYVYICLPLLVFIGPPRIAKTSFKVHPSEMLWRVNTKINHNHQNAFSAKCTHNYMLAYQAECLLSKI